MSNRPEHSPGPWQASRALSPLDAVGPWPVAAYDRGGRFVGSFFFAERDGEGPANARLVLAAPDLLEACKAAIEVFRDMDLLHLVAFDQLDAAIAKAEGHADTTAANPPVAAQDAPRAIPGNTSPDPASRPAGPSRGLQGPYRAHPADGGGRDR